MRLAWTLVLLSAGVSAWAGDLLPLSSAEFCGRCHRAILDAWKRSAHAKAMESALFQEALETAEAEFGTDAARICVTCHSPIALHTKDRSLRQKVSWEGVTCEYCHSIRDVAFTGPNPEAKVEYSLVKSGPLKDAVAPVHGVAYSPVHTNSLACAPCHEYRNTLGMPVLTTYSEWKDSRYGREGKHCQSCHMSKVAGDVVDPKIRRSAEAQVNLHEMSGSRSLDQLTKAVTARLQTDHQGNELKVSVEVANAAAGHYVPTGSPMRHVVLEVRADSRNGQRFRETREYRRRVVDEQGKQLEREGLALLKGTKVISDTRLAPDEKRTETFSFQVPAGIMTDVKATLWYYFSPQAEAEARQRVMFLRIQRLVK